MPLANLLDPFQYYVGKVSGPIGGGGGFSAQVLNPYLYNSSNMGSPNLQFYIDFGNYNYYGLTLGTSYDNFGPGESITCRYGAILGTPPGGTIDSPTDTFGDPVRKNSFYFESYYLGSGIGTNEVINPGSTVLRVYSDTSRTTQIASSKTITILGGRNNNYWVPYLNNGGFYKWHEYGSTNPSINLSVESNFNSTDNAPGASNGFGANAGMAVFLNGTLLYNEGFKSGFNWQEGRYFNLMPQGGSGVYKYYKYTDPYGSPSGTVTLQKNTIYTLTVDLNLSTGGKQTKAVNFVLFDPKVLGQ